eukprot:snap_masked-scaffold_37-processed-gene-2.31-mRNA-1 protein AED:1.00 eAED:1.00 QI:0/-1/0/0/-1/1/1/0/61
MWKGIRRIGQLAAVRNAAPQELQFGYVNVIEASSVFKKRKKKMNKHKQRKRRKAEKRAKNR